MPSIDAEEGKETVPTVPWVDEANPGLGRRSGVVEHDRQQSGGLSDESPEDPVRDDDVYRPYRGRR